MSARAACFVAAAAASALLAPVAAAQLSSVGTLDKEFSGIVKRVAPAVVLIDVGPKLSGVVINSSGWVLTDATVAQLMQQAKPPRATVDVIFPDRKRFTAKLVRADLSTGSAMLKIDQKALPAVRPGDPGQLLVGNFLLTIGNAFGSAEESTPAVTMGVVSDIHVDSSGRPLLIETSAATNPGQNGGPYFDVDGELVGLARNLPDGQNLATVTPIDRLRETYRDLPDAARIFPPPGTMKSPETKGRTLSQAFHVAAERARRGVVTLIVSRKPAATAPATTTTAESGSGEARPQEPPAPLVPMRVGPLTGALVTKNGFVLAPDPAFGDDVDAIEAVLSDGRRYRATVVGRDRKVGLALLLLDKPAADVLEPLEELSQDQLSIGQFVIAVGAPHVPGESLGPFTTVGFLSNMHRLDGWRDALETDAGVNVKNAGGLLVDLRGRALGVLLPPMAPFGQNSGLGFAMPMDAVRKSLALLSQGKVLEPGYMGIVLADAPGAAGGVLVGDVTPGFPADQAGLKTGDVISKVNGIDVKDRQAFSNVLATKFSAGDELVLAVRRANAPLEVRLVLVRRP